MMRRREFIAGLAGAAASPVVARAQQPAKVWRIGMMERDRQELGSANLAAFRNGLRENGYIEGQNLVIDYRFADGRDERFPEMAAELVRLKVDLITARGIPAVLAVKNATGAIPVVMTGVGDPLASGIVASLARPGSNVTGLSSFSNEVQAKRVELLRDLVPGIRRIASLYDLGNPGSAVGWEGTQLAARSLAIEAFAVDVRDVRGALDLQRLMDAASEQHIDALQVPIDAITYNYQREIVDFAARNKLPAVYDAREFVDAGGLMAYGISYPQLYRRAATFVDKIFKGAKPADLPVEQPTQLALVINLKTAKALGLTVPQSILLRADEVIE
jgi:putative ABC transport system substrate-binding protein